MLTFITISAVLGNTPSDQTDQSTAVIVVVGIVLFIIFASMLASSGTKAVMVKKFCPYCSRKINYSPTVTNSKTNTPLNNRVQQKNQLQIKQRKQRQPDENAPVLRKGSKTYCPYCKGPLSVTK